MITLLRADIARLSTLHSSYAVPVALLVLVGRITAGSLAPAGDAGFITSIQLREPVTASAGRLSAVAFALFAAIRVAGEYRYGTIGQRLLASPRRQRLLATTFLTHGLLGLAVGSLGLGLLGDSPRDARGQRPKPGHDPTDRSGRRAGRSLVQSHRRVLRSDASQPAGGGSCHRGRVRRREAGRHGHRWRVRISPLRPTHATAAARGRHHRQWPSRRSARPHHRRTHHGHLRHVRSSRHHHLIPARRQHLKEPRP
jgi:hypothetical protein